jgi:hypothetical protein
MVFTTSSCIPSIISGFMTFWDIVLEKEHNLMRVSRTYVGKIFLTANGRICVIITWQSCDFIPFSFFPSISTKLLMFEE